MTAVRSLPLRVERLHHVFRVEHEAHAAADLRLHMSFTFRAVGELEAELAIERERASHVADHDAESVELRAHGASAVSAVRSPSSPAIGCMAATTLRM